MTQIVIISTDPALQTELKTLLAEMQYGLVSIPTWEGNQSATHHDTAMFLWDVEGLSMEVVRQGCEMIRREQHLQDVPILFLNRGANAKVNAQLLDAGGDDILKKPIVTREFQARIRAMLRWRTRFDQMSTPSLSLNANLNEVQLGHKRVQLTPIEFSLVEFLCQHGNDYFSAEDLLTKLWNYPPHSGDTALVRNHIRNLRCKLEVDPDHPRIIVSQYGRGYAVRALVDQAAHSSIG